MNTTTAQNHSHRTDIAWTKTAGRSFDASGEHFISEYVNPWTGQAIRKSWRMTGLDWFIFNTEGEIVDRAHSLTWAKMAAEA